MVTAWSAEVLDASIEPIPSISTRTRSPWKPRSTGREAPGAKQVADTPGSLASISPSWPAMIALQLVALQHRGARQHVELLEARRGDDDHVVVEIVVVVPVVRRRSGSDEPRRGR